MYSNLAHNGGWVVKGPFSTNKQVRYFVKSSTSIFQVVKSIITKAGKGIIADLPYVMLQPRMANSFERKVACFGGVTRYIATSHGNSCGVDKKSFNANNPGKTIAFAQSQAALDYAKERLGECLISEGLFRVDIFQVSEEKYVVNEFESLDADVYGTSGDRNNHEAMLRQDLVKYWGSIIQDQVLSVVQELLKLR